MSAVTNPNLNDIKRMLEIYNSNYFFDNKEIMAYVSNLDGNGRNFFERYAQKVLRLDFSQWEQNEFFVLKTATKKTIDSKEVSIENTDTYYKLTDVVVAIKAITNVLYDMVETSYADIYKTIKIR